jgi:uncharacterized membrane protein (UPF0182 family)
LSRSGEGLGGLRRRWLLWLVIGVAAVAILFTALAGFYIDILWFREVQLSSVFWTVFRTRINLALIFGAAFFLLLYVNLLIVRAIRPRYRVYSPEEEYVERYRVAFEPYARWVLPAVSVLFALFAATGVAGRWVEFQLWRASGDVSFGVADPLFERDVAFYVLSLPFQKFVQGWLFSSLVVVTLVTAGAHYLWGGIRPRAVTERVTPQVKAHLSVLLGLAVLVKAWGYRLGQFDLLTSPRGVVDGASYTDVNAQLPALRVLVYIAIICAVLFLVNIRFRGWALPALGVGLLGLTSVVAGAAYPAFIQRFRVAPQELQRERPYIQSNIEFSRKAFGLDAVEPQTFAAEPDITQTEIDAATGIVDNIRQWNPDVLKRAYLQLQRIRQYYEFTDVDVDRYEIEGRRRVVMVGAREIDQDGIPGGGSWQNRHLRYTHGYGAAATRVDQVTSEGAPAFALQDIPVTGSIELQEPRVYFAEEAKVPFVVVGAEVDEFDFPQAAEGEAQFAETRYAGSGGIEIGGILRRTAFAWRFRDVNLLISGLIQGDSRILINTEIQDRVQKIAPFLKYDHDPYAAIVDGRVVWIWDAYTTSDAYPYSQRVNLGELTGNDLEGRANYIRNSVKVVIDAYDGTTTFYLVDEADAIIQAWSNVFPDLFTPLAEAPMSLREHFRYPEDLFRVQAHQYANYHVTEADQFYEKSDFWAVPRVAKGPRVEEAELEPYYVLLPLPGETEERFVLFTPFTPSNRPNMTSWMAAVSDPDDYGRLVSFVFPSGRNVSGPSQVASFISQDTDVSREVTLLGQLGSQVTYGDLLAIPIAESFLWVQPLYLESEQAAAIPELKRVIVVHGNAVTMAENLPTALANSFVPGAAPPEETPPPGEEPVEPTPPPTPPPTGDVASLLAEAAQRFQAAEDLLRQGDLAGYQREIEAAQAAVEQARQLAGG